MQATLFLADTQLDVSNIERWRVVVKDVLRYCAKHRVKHVVHLGDLKEALHLIDGRVLSAFAEGLRLWQAAGLIVHLLIGNHDAYGTTSASGSWADVLTQMGVRVHSGISEDMLADWPVVWLPYQFPETTQHAKAFLRNYTPASKNTLLLFHQGLEGAMLTVDRKARGERWSVADLCPEKFHACFGGHYHGQHQPAGNVWYCGSSFATRWGEANQVKGYLLLTKTGEVVCLPSSVPGWYDPALPNFPDPVPAGARVRIHVPVDSPERTQEQLITAREWVRALYGDVEVVALAAFAEEGVGLLAEPGKVYTHDEPLLDDYLATQFPGEEEGERADAVRAYVLEALAKASGGYAPAVDFELVSLEAENYQSFAKLSIDYTRKGVNVVFGTNKDRAGKSNGAGKTTYLAAAVAGWWGADLKEQKHDELVRRDIDPGERSFLRVVGKLGDGRFVTVERHRKPKPSVSLTVDGEDFTAGRGDTEINKTLTKLTGFNRDTFAAALYVNQREVNKLLTGTEGEKREILAAFLNLRRFADAGKLLQEIFSAEERELREHRQKVAVIAAQINGVYTLLATLEELSSEAREKLEAEEKSLREQIREGLAEEVSLGKLPQVNTDSLRLVQNAHQQKQTFARDRAAFVTERSNLLRENQVDMVCPTCGAALSQETVEDIRGNNLYRVEQLETLIAELDKQAAHHASQLPAASKAVKEWEAASITYREKTSRIRANREALNRRLKAVLLELENTAASVQAEAANRRLTALYHRSRAAFAMCAISEDRLALLRVARAAVARDGMPAILSAQLCPRLNRAASFYSGLVGDGSIRVSFRMSDDELTVDIGNDSGGSTLKGQSCGEMQLAALITTLAMRDQTRSNVLFLDEATLGLDPQAAREFAHSLPALTERFDTIYLTTHDPFLLAGVGEHERVEIVKQAGVSEVVSSGNTDSSRAQRVLPSKSKRGRANA